MRIENESKIDRYGYLDATIHSNMLNITHPVIKRATIAIAIVGSVALIGAGCGLGITGLVIGGVLLFLASCLCGMNMAVRRRLP